MLNEILVARLHAGAARASAPLLAISGNWRALQITAVADRNRYLLVGDQVLEMNFGGFVFNDRAALVTIELLDFLELADDHLAQLLLRAENRFVFGDVFARGPEFFVDFVDRKAR